MKKIFVILSLISSTHLVADYSRIGMEQGTRSKPSRGSSSGSSSCSQECIDCECYTPGYHPLDCALGLFATGDFLYWFARDSALTYAVTTATTNITPFNNFPDAVSVEGFLISPVKSKSLDPSWNSGARAGIGLNRSPSGWDLYATWTYFRTQKHSSISLPPFNSTNIDFGQTNFPFTEAIISPWVSLETNLGGIGNQALPYFNLAVANWKFTYNIFDLELARKYWLSKDFTLRPFIGVRGGWTKNRFSTRGELDVFGPHFAAFEIHSVIFSNKFRGVGLLGGFQPEWFFGSHLSLFGNAEFALLWGNFDVKRKETIVQNNILFSLPLSTDKFFGMQPIFDLGAGIR